MLFQYSQMIGGAIGVGFAGGAIRSAKEDGNAADALLGGLAGGGSVAATAGSGFGLSGLFAGGISIGPVGWLALGATESDDGNHVTYDCWKPVIHDVSEAPSDGMLLKDVASHPNVADVTIAPGFCDQLPHIVLKNVWDEEFEVEYLAMLDTGKLVCHAKAINV